MLGQPQEKFKLWLETYESPFYRSNFLRDTDGYKSFSTMLGMGTWHMVMVSKRRGFMPCISEEAIWQELSSSNYTTPLLKDWSKPLYEKLSNLPRLLLRDRCFGCECGMLQMEDARLDGIVVDLLREGKISVIPKGLNKFVHPDAANLAGSGERKKCHRCDGYGKINVTYGLEICPICKGAGVCPPEAIALR